MKLTVEDLIALSYKQFQYQAPVKSLWQVIANHFYPERADFTFVRNIGHEYADHLSDSFPTLIRRDLGNSLSAMLRDGDWFDMGVQGRRPDYAGRVWLQQSTHALRHHMYHREANFIRAMKEGDHDFVTFGQCVKSVEFNYRQNCMLYRSWHLRDCAWWEDEAGAVCGVARKAKQTRRDLVQYFGADKLHSNIVEPTKLQREPFTDHDTLHMVMPSYYYGDDEIESKFPYVSVWIDAENKHLIEVRGITHKYYVIPRFHTISGSAYAYSPATSVGLPDARVLQAMTHTLMEAAERYARPPVIATAGATRGDINLRADGITYVDKDYDEHMGAALRYLAQDKSGWPIGDAERERINKTLQSAFYTSKLTLPDPETSREMTAYEVAERMKGYRRENLPLFAPIEHEDNGQVCELSFQIAMENNLLGSPYDIPPSVRGGDVEFKFVTPLSAMESEEQAQRFERVRSMVTGVIEVDPMIGAEVDLAQALRDAIEGIDAPQRWLTPPEEALQARQMAALSQVAGAAQG